MRQRKSLQQAARDGDGWAALGILRDAEGGVAMHQFSFWELLPYEAALGCQTEAPA